MVEKQFDKFVVYWWFGADGSTLSRFSTKSSADIEAFTDERYRVRLSPITVEDEEERIEIILCCRRGKWTVKCDSFAEASEEYPIAFSFTDEGAVWTDAQSSELFVVTASRAC